MKITVILGTYNGENYIGDQLDSLRLQTLRPDKVIISDDCSTDNTIALIKNYINKYNLSDDWYLSVNKNNVGFRKNFIQLMLKISEGIVFFCDQDDIWDKDKVNMMRKCHSIINKPCCVVSDVEQFTIGNSKKERIVDYPIKNEILIAKDLPLYRVKMSKENLENKRPGWSFAFHYSLAYNVIKSMNENELFFHDEVLWLQSLVNNNLYHLKYNTGFWRRSENSETSNSSKYEDVLSRNKTYLNKTILLLQHCLIDNKEISESKKRILLEEIDILILRKKVIIDHKIFPEYFILILKQPIVTSIKDIIKMLIIFI